VIALASSNGVDVLEVGGGRFIRIPQNANGRHLIEKCQTLFPSAYAQFSDWLYERTARLPRRRERQAANRSSGVTTRRLAYHRAAGHRAQIGLGGEAHGLWIGQAIEDSKGWSVIASAHHRNAIRAWRA
jgi:hypothetical protein